MPQRSKKKVVVIHQGKGVMRILDKSTEGQKKLLGPNKNVILKKPGGAH